MGRHGYGISKGFRMLVLQFIEDLSDRELERFLQENMVGKWFCGFELEEATPDYTYFSKLRQKIGTTRLSKLFQACEDCLTPAPRVITAQNAYLINNALQDVIQHGTGRAALVLHRSDLAGKTGTTNNQADAWFSGFNTDIVTTVWIGFDDLESLYEYGAQAALPIWINFMREALKGKSENSMPQPTGLVSVQIDPQTGLLANPAQTNGIFEIFRQDHVPTEVAPLPDNTVLPAPSQDQTAQNQSKDESLF